MKKFVCALACVGMLALTGVADAAVKTFDTMSVDVPAGWTTQSQGSNAVVLMAPEQKGAVLVANAPAEGKSAKELAASLATEAQKVSADVKVSSPVAEGDGYIIKLSAHGQENTMYITVVKGTAFICTSTGNMAEFMKIAKSAKPK